MPHSDHARSRRRPLSPLGSLGSLALAVVSLVTLVPATSSAAGLYFSDRGVRPTGRGGAFVAGADDLGSIWYNPAGVAFAGDAVLADASYLRFGSSYQRESLVHDPNTGKDVVVGADYYPAVKGTSPLLPLPTLAISNSLGLKDWNFALGVMAPYAALTTYPEQQLNFNGRTISPPQRYSLITLDGSALTVVGAWASYKPSDRVAIGLGLEALVGRLDFEDREGLRSVIRDFEEVDERLPRAAEKMGELIAGADKWYLQNFKSDTSLIDESLQGKPGFTEKEMKELAGVGRKYVKICEVRG